MSYEEEDACIRASDTAHGDGEKDFARLQSLLSSNT
jgi:hypothetical protein